MGDRMKKIVQVGTRTFESRAALEREVRSVVDRNKDHQPLTGADFDFMRDLIKLHPRADIKIGAGIVALVFLRNPVFPSSRTLYLRRADNTTTDVSWRECINPSSYSLKVLSAMRTAIQPDTLHFMQSFFERAIDPHCPYNNEPLTFSNSHVDHIYPQTFKQLAADFLGSIDLNSIELKDELADNKVQDVLADAEFERLWIMYHRQHAQLRVISAKANMARGANNE